MLSHPGMRFRAGFEGKGFNDRCISLIYLAAEDERFDPGACLGKIPAARPARKQPVALSALAAAARNNATRAHARRSM